MEWSANPDALHGRVAVVAGQLEAPDVASLLPWAKLAKRHSTRLNPSEYNRAETVEETAELVTRSAAPFLRHCVTSKLRAATVALSMRGWRETKSASIDARRFQPGDNV